MKGIIYKYTFSDGKVYIGQTRRHPEKRKREHFDELVGPTNTGFWDAYKKLGKPDYEELLQIERDDVDELVYELNIAESLFIQLYMADNPIYGYNKKPFGNVGTKRNVIIQRAYDDYTNTLLEERLRVYKSATYKIWHSNEPLTKEEYYLIREKYRKKNFWQSNIEDFFENPKNSHKRDFWLDEALDFVRKLIIEEVEEEASQYISNNYLKILEEEKNKNAIVQIDNDGQIVREFYSFNEICQAFDVPRADNVKNVLKGRQKSAYGYYWKYKKDL